MEAIGDEVFMWDNISTRNVITQVANVSYVFNYGSTSKYAILGVESQELILVNNWNLKCEIVPNSDKYI